MPRRVSRLALFAALAAGPAAGQPGGPADKVTYRTADGRVAVADGEVKESAAGVQVLVAGKVKLSVSPTDVARVDPGQLPGVPRADLLAAVALEDGKDPAKAQAAFAGLVAKAGPETAGRARRYLAGREAVWAAKVADGKPADEFRADAPRAADKLVAAGRLAKASWEVWPALRTAARLHIELDDFAKAADILGELAGVPDLPKELRLEARLAEAGAHLRAGRGAAAEAALDQVAKDPDLPAGGPLRERLTVVRAAGRSADPAAGLAEAVDAAKDPVAKAVGYNLLGDALSARGRPREALWAYLWADVVFNQDKDEQVLAVRRAAGVFDKLGDPDRAAQFRDKLPRVR